MLKAGDVVFGPFAVKGETLTDHHSVVVSLDMSGKEPRALLVYTTSMKPGDEQVRRKYSREFTPTERTLANWKNPCRYEANKLALVPVSMLEQSGRVPTKALLEIEQEVSLAFAKRAVDCNEFNRSHPERVTGFVSRKKREMATR